MSTRIKVGQIPYLNCEPFYHGLVAEEVELCPLSPRAMGELAIGGELDAGPFSLMHCFDLWDQYEPLGNMGISVKGQVKSVVLFSRLPLEELSGATIGITPETATAVNLLRLLLEQRHALQPRAYTDLDSLPLDALLLIGDKALLHRNGMPDFPYRYDLAAEWFHWQGLPFVFALWMVRRSMDSHLKEMLAAVVRKRLEDNLVHNLEAIAAKRSNLEMTAQEVASYLQTFRYLLTEEDWQAIETFKSAWLALPMPVEARR